MSSDNMTRQADVKFVIGGGGMQPTRLCLHCPPRTPAKLTKGGRGRGALWMCAACVAKRVMA
jgi:hypothetical protein